MTHKEIETALEEMVDAQGMVAILTALVNICHEKADHVESNWQDAALAKQWRKASHKLDVPLRADWPF